MSLFFECDRCQAREPAIIGNHLPNGWEKVCGLDLCDTCVGIVRRFLRPETAPLFEATPPAEPGPPLELANAAPPNETTTEERARERKAKKLRGQDAILPDPRKPGDPPAPAPGAQP